MLAIEVEFLTGRFVATSYNSRAEGEWPPHPARLFSALAATHFADEVPNPAEQSALKWLEQQAPPLVGASEASHRQVVAIFVPVNDVGMTNVDTEAEAVDQAKADLEQYAGGPSPDGRRRMQFEAAVTQATRRLASALTRAVSVPARPLDPRRGLRVLPEHRLRQPRTLPSVTPTDPRVRYVWPDATPTSNQRVVIDGLLARLVRLGHSSSFVAAKLIDDPGKATWRPSPSGEQIFRTVAAGQLDALTRAFALHREIEPRVMPATFQAYTRRAPDVVAPIPASVMSDDWLVFRRVGGPQPPMVATTGIARALRGALMSHSTDPIVALLSGHTIDGQPSATPHLAIVPLPFLGHHAASGAILGIALIPPRAATTDERLPIYAAVAAWERVNRLEDEDAPSLPLMLGAAGVLQVERVEGGSVPASLRAATWCRASRVWYSATPVALDRNPGDLRAHDPRRLAAATAEAEATVTRACSHIGLPEPCRVDVLPAAPWAGAAKARRYPPFPGSAGRTQRVLTHARLVFAEEVRGPILLGAGRYVGLGLFRPEAPRG